MVLKMNRRWEEYGRLRKWTFYTRICRLWNYCECIVYNTFFLIIFRFLVSECHLHKNCETNLKSLVHQKNRKSLNMDFK